jgi:hypothetical protein
MDYKGAGVLIYKISDEKVYFLLGKENMILSNKCNKGNKFCDFGGKKDLIDNNYIDTASREFYEETMGSFYTLCEIKDLLINCTVFYNDKYKYHQFLLKDNISDDKVNTYNKIRSYLNSCMQFIPQNTSGSKAYASENTYYQKLPCCPDGYVEKSEIRWFELSDIITNHTIFRHEFVNSLLKILNQNILN